MRRNQLTERGDLAALPPFLHDLLANPPVAGAGVHTWLFRVARQLHTHLPAGEIVQLLLDRTASCGRHVPSSEIIAAVQSSLGCAWRPSSQVGLTRSTTKWPEPNMEQIEAIVAQGRGFADLWELSPVRLVDSKAWTEEVIDYLFPGNPLLCCGRSQSEFATKQRQQWRGQLARLQFIVPNAMSARLGRKKNPVPRQSLWSAHTLDNTGPRHFLVIECDFSLYARDGGTETKFAPLIRRQIEQQRQIADLCAAVLLHLAELAPLVLCVHSGGKSLHGWFRCGGESEEKLLRFMRYAVSLGADAATWTRSQFVRMPDGMRDNGQKQTIHFFNPL